MKELKKRPSEADEMLITHKPALAPDPDKVGKHAAAPMGLAAREGEALQALTLQLANSKDKRKRKALLESIQKNFGNEAASRAIRDAGEGEMEAIPAVVAKPKSPEKGKA